MTFSKMNEATDQEDLIQLEPLVHQVGGHSSIFVLDDVTVCKPLIGREYQFYRSLPPEMKQYTPEFRGSLQVVIQEDRDGLSMAALPNEQTVLLRNTQTDPFNHGNLRRLSSSSLDFEYSSSSDEGHSPHEAACRGIPPVLFPGGNPKNPWLVECQKNHLSKLKQKSDSSNVVECIMLENLTFKFRYPCVLDLKMGTRQYGDDAPDSKRRSQTMKAANTTTASLGVRLVGMQVYNKEKKCFTCKNKYFGRQLSEESFKQTLRQFLHNGKRLQLDTASVVIAKLKELRSIVSKLDSFRFFTSSLLIIYDSLESPFKLTSCASESPEGGREAEAARPDWQNYVPPDRDAVKGSMEVPSKEVQCPRERDSLWIASTPSCSVKPAPSSTPSSLASIGDSGCCLPYSKKGRRRPRAQPKARVDIRMIDFAHATHSDMGDSVKYKGPDEGILLGLNSLIKIFNDIRETYRESGVDSDKF